MCNITSEAECPAAYILNFMNNQCVITQDAMFVVLESAALQKGKYRVFFLSCKSSETLHIA